MAYLCIVLLERTKREVYFYSVHVINFTWNKINKRPLDTLKIKVLFFSINIMVNCINILLYIKHDD